jgi:hypothetical protein
MLASRPSVLFGRPAIHARLSLDPLAQRSGIESVPESQRRILPADPSLRYDLRAASAVPTPSGRQLPSGPLSPEARGGAAMSQFREGEHPALASEI